MLIISLSSASSAAAANAQGATSAASELSASATPIDWDRQIAFEDQALRVMKLKPMQDAIRSAAKIYAEHPLASYPDGRRTLRNAVEAIALSAINYAQNDPESPVIVWSANAAHRYGKKAVRGSGYGVDNPDNFYRMLSIDGSKRYEIRGYRKPFGPAAEVFLLYETIPGTAGMNREGAKVLAALTLDAIQVDADGRFTVFVDSDSGAGKTNHLQTPAGANDLLMIIRDTLVDWGAEAPNPLRIVRTDQAPSQPARSDEEIAIQAANILAKIVPFWLQYFDNGSFKFAANTTKPLWGRAGGWGYASGGWFNLKDDEAMVVTLSSMGARYLGFQLSDVWGVAPEYIRHTSSLNSMQARRNADGTYTYVISAKDPGVWNWLDTVGLKTGLFAIRWQGLSESEVETRLAVRESKVVKLRDLQRALPEGVKKIDRQERLAQQKERERGYGRRLDGMPVGSPAE